MPTTTTTETRAKIAAFPQDVQDRAREWVNTNVEIDDDAADFDAEYDAEVLSACEEIAAIDEVNDRADRLAGVR